MRIQDNIFYFLNFYTYRKKDYTKTFSKFVTDVISSVHPINPKSLLERDKEIHIGDFVTIDNNERLIVYIVTDISNDGEEAKIIYLSLTDTKDDFYFKEINIKKSKLLYLDESFVTLKSPLWDIHKNLIKEG